MKLAAGNPNLKVNKQTGLGSFAFTTGDKAHIKERTGFRPSVKPPDAAPPPQMSLWAREVYTPPRNEYIHPGANDFLNIKSRGF
jgi:hypothetical protein